MEVQNLRRVEDYYQIRKSIIEILESRNKASLWQNVQGNRYLYNSFILRMDRLDRYIEFASKGNDFIFNSLHPIYMYFPHKCTIFKSNITFNSNFKIEIPWPSEIMTKEMRDHPRDEFTEEDKVQIQFIKGNPDVGDNKTFVKNILDLSPLGLSFRATKYDVNSFYEGDPITILSIAGHENENIKAKINYIAPIRYGDHQTIYYRVGVLLDNPLQ